MKASAPRGEKPIQDAIVELLPALGVFAWRNNTGQRGGVRFGKRGSADILGCVSPSGRLVALEVKTAKGQQSEDQRAFEAAVKRAGGFYAVVRSVEDAIRAVTQARDGFVP